MSRQGFLRSRISRLSSRLRAARANGQRKGVVWDAPMVVGVLVALGGLVDVLGALDPRSRFLEAFEWTPAPVAEFTRAPNLLLGVLMLAVARKLAARHRNAWLIAISAAAASTILHLIHRPDVDSALLTGTIVLLLAATRDAFVARSDPFTLRRALISVPVLASAVFGYGLAGFWALRHQIYPEPTLLGALRASAELAILLAPRPYVALTDQARWFFDGVSFVGAVSLIYLLFAFLRPALERRPQRHDADVARLVRLYGWSSNSAFALLRDKSHLLAADGRAAVAYRAVGGVAVALGDPICSDEHAAEAVDAFLDLCARRGWRPCFYRASDRFLDLYARKGLSWVKMGEEAIIDAQKFTLSGGRMQIVRHAVRKVEGRDHIRIIEYRRDERDPEMDRKLREVTRLWLSGKKSAPMTFTLGDFDPDRWTDERVFVATDDRGEVYGFTTWLPYDRQGTGRPLGYIIDRMPRRPDAPTGVMDAVIARAILAMREDGVFKVSLANAPLANVNADDPAALSRLDRAVRLLYENFNQVYGYKSLFRFKRKFQPCWESRYLVYAGPASLPSTVRAIVSVLNPEGIRSYLKTPLRAGIRPGAA